MSQEYHSFFYIFLQTPFLYSYIVRTKVQYELFSTTQNEKPTTRKYIFYSMFVTN